MSETTLKRLLLAAVLLAGIGCNPDSSEDRFPVDVQAQDLESAELAHGHSHGPPTFEKPTDPAEANELERVAKSNWNIAPTSQVEEIDWAAANGYTRIALDELPTTEQEKVGQAALPVMLPRQAEVLETTILTLGENWYAASLKDNGASLHIRGTRVSYDFDGDVWTPEERAMGDDYTLTRTHQIVSVSFASFGAAYTIDVECSRPMDDVRCTEDEYALNLANELAVAGGLR